MESLPNEMIDLILQHARPVDLWTFRACNRRMRDLASEAFIRLHVRTQLLKTDIGLRIWRRGGPGAVITFKFQEIDCVDPEYAVFKVASTALMDPGEDRRVPDWRARARQCWQDYTDVYTGGESKFEKMLRIEIGDQVSYAQMLVEKLSAEQGSALSIRWRKMYASLFTKMKVLDSITEVKSVEA